MSTTKTRVCNVICTADLDQLIDIEKLNDLPCGIYDQAIYGGRCGYVKTPGMVGRVTLFSSGKMISIGAKSTKNAKEQLHQTIFYLKKEKLIHDVKITPIIRNIVAVSDLKKNIPMKKLALKFKGSIYNPDIFPGVILKGLYECSFLIFSTGKIVQTKGTTINQTHNDLEKVISRINDLMFN
jgi:TATA-box binding protein (TBP) (component of TFIID and TFIIIB)